MRQRYASQESCPAAQLNPGRNLKTDRLEHRSTGACESIPARSRDPRPQHLQGAGHVSSPLEQEIANIFHTPQCSPARPVPAKSRAAERIFPRKSTAVLERHRTPSSLRSPGDQGENPEAGFEVGHVLRMRKRTTVLSFLRNTGV